MEKTIYNSLFRVYSEACKTENLKEEAREVMLTDSWKLLE